MQCVYVMKCMSQMALVEAYREFLEGIQILRLLADRLGRRQILENVCLQGSPIFTEIVNEYEKNAKQPWLLQRCCSHVVWRACRMRMINVKDLPIPGPLKKIVIQLHCGNS
uniref:Uncharacterized protein n=1 Tax=Arion vulgaris TaxID=1028688 RepID=A0A0B6Y0K0_9EUPU